MINNAHEGAHEFKCWSTRKFCCLVFVITKWRLGTSWPLAESLGQGGITRGLHSSSGRRWVYLSQATVFYGECSKQFCSEDMYNASNTTCILWPVPKSDHLIDLYSNIDSIFNYLSFFHLVNWKDWKWVSTTCNIKVYWCLLNTVCILISFTIKMSFPLFLSNFRERTIISAKKKTVLLCFHLIASRVIAFNVEHLQYLLPSGKKKKKITANTDPFFSIWVLLKKKKNL